MKPRDIIKMVEQFENLSIDRIVTGSHNKVYINCPEGKKLLVVGSSSSDRKAESNNRSILRRWNNTKECSI